MMAFTQRSNGTLGALYGKWHFIPARKKIQIPCFIIVDKSEIGLSLKAIIGSKRFGFFF